MEVYSKVREDFPNAEIVINSTAGEIFDAGVETQTIVVTGIEFEETKSKQHKLALVIPVRVIKPLVSS
jgi:hypothetical protein